MAENGDGENMSILESKICQQIEVSSIYSLDLDWDVVLETFIGRGLASGKLAS